ncbi:MAG TPA: hypothetical protein PLW02_04940 [Verrucomicrobiota bacterium]|nr:hypothetical protein [Verrucomicrobiota bacterium]
MAINTSQKGLDVVLSYPVFSGSNPSVDSRNKFTQGHPTICKHSYYPLKTSSKLYCKRLD